jgi:tetratricopeptide (TPR) repeat protein
MKDIAFYFIGGFVVALAIYFVTTLFKVEKAGSTLLQEAAASYSLGEKAGTLAERQEQFNTALKDYHELAAEFHPDMGNGKLYFNLANTYYQLGEYPRAVYYYYKALKLAPGDDDIRRNLSIALDKLDLSPPNAVGNWQSILLLQEWLPLPRQLQLFFGISLVLFALGSAWIWLGIAWTRYGISIFGTLLLLLCASL